MSPFKQQYISIIPKGGSGRNDTEFNKFTVKNKKQLPQGQCKIQPKATVGKIRGFAQNLEEMMESYLG